MRPRLAAERGSGLLKRPDCFSRALREFEGKDWPQRVFGQVGGAHWLELTLLGERDLRHVPPTCSPSSWGFCKMQNWIQ